MVEDDELHRIGKLQGVCSLTNKFYQSLGRTFAYTCSAFLSRSSSAVIASLVTSKRVAIKGLQGR
jgi:hypothetical protein